MGRKLGEYSLLEIDFAISNLPKTKNSCQCSSLFLFHGDKIQLHRAQFSLITRNAALHSLLFVSYVVFQGDKGYCYIPYDYLANSEFCFDVWTLRKVATGDFGQDHWDNDDSTDYRQVDNNDQDNDNDDNHAIEGFDEDDGNNW